MTLYWDILLETDDPEAALRMLYESHGSVNSLAEYLGVSGTALRGALKKYGIELRPKGGPHPSPRRGRIPDNFSNWSAEELAEATGYSLSYCKRLIREERRIKKDEHPKGPVQSR